MADKTGIEWTDASWNPLRGCSRVSEGCRNCYAETVAGRFCGPGQPYEGLAKLDAKGNRRWTGDVRLIESALDQPLRWQRPRMIFVNSMSDPFHEKVPDEVIDRIFAVMALARQHTFQVLTKRPERMRAYMQSRRPHENAPPFAKDDWPYANIWLGVSVEDQPTADERIPLLLQTPAAKRFISAEPLLGPVNLTGCDTSGESSMDALNPVTWEQEIEQWRGSSDTWEEDFLDWYSHKEMPKGQIHPVLDWVICGGESGSGARPMHPDWARSLRDQCAAAGVPYFFKQWGEWRPPCDGEEYDTANGRAGKPPAFIVAPNGTVHCFKNNLTDAAEVMIRVGKRRAGSLLDGREHKDVPVVENV